MKRKRRKQKIAERESMVWKGEERNGGFESRV